jgi:hypothetical protein
VLLVHTLRTPGLPVHTHQRCPDFISNDQFVNRCILRRRVNNRGGEVARTCQEDKCGHQDRKWGDTATTSPSDTMHSGIGRIKLHITSVMNTETKSLYFTTG